MEAALGRVGEGIRIAFILARQAVFSVGQNWGIALLSIVLASSLWVYVTNREDKLLTGRVPGAVSVECVNVPPDQAESPPCNEQSVTVRVRAPQSVFNDLTANDCKATADVGGVSSAGETVSVNVVCNRARVEVLDWSPSQIRVTLENVATRSVAVRVQVAGAPPQGFRVQTVTVQPTEVVVAGPASLVARVASVDADLDLTAVRADLDQTVQLKARDERGAEIHGVNLDHKSADVHVTMQQVQFSAVFVVKPDISGSPAPGFIAAGVQIDPPFVSITGTAQVFQSLDPSKGLSTEAISIDGASADVVRTVALRLPQGATVERPGVTVRVIIRRADLASPTP
jgi:YbbR domain-containing protein